MSRVFDFIRQLEAEARSAAAGSDAPHTDDNLAELRDVLSVLHLPHGASPPDGVKYGAAQATDTAARKACVHPDTQVVRRPGLRIPADERNVDAGPGSINSLHERELRVKALDMPSSVQLQNHKGAPAKHTFHEAEPLHLPVHQLDVIPESRVVCYTEPRSPAADRFRFLRMRLSELSKRGKARTILITSALPKEGKSTTALNLATILAEEGKRRVLLVDGDLHHSSIARRLGITLQRGLSDCLHGHADPYSVMCRVDPLGWYLLTAGEAPAHPTELLQSDAFAPLVRKLSADFEWVIFDSAPVIPLTDAVSMAQHTDATLLVAKAGSTPKKAIEAAMLLLGRAQLLGIILNGVETLNREYPEYREYYGVNLRQE